ncbi:helix-turn-helix domain-containing protein [Pectobacterium brasiliense]|uniref:helix-turn-helix domain-containing protein n=1 Tax=Pectobacterium brasiliense TaxID=180957 RepID=UPI0009079958
MNDEVWTIEEAAKNLKMHRDTVKSLVKRGVLPASDIGSGQRHIYRFVKSACLEAMSKPINTARVNAGDITEKKPCQSNNGTVSGTVISLRRMEKELDSLLGQRTGGKRKNCMTS